MDAEIIRQIVTKTEVYLKRHLVLLDPVVEKLHGNGVIGEYTKKRLLDNKGNSQKQVELLLSALRCRGIEALRGFLDALRMSYYGWIADEILSTAIEIDTKTATGNKTFRNVSDIVKQSHQPKTSATHVSDVKGNAYSNGLPVVPYVIVQPPGSYWAPGFDHGRENRRRRQNPHNEVSPVERIPENMRHLRNMFEKETSTTQKSLKILRNEEDTIKSLLQQNLREQKQTIGRQEVLLEIRDRIRQIDRKTSHLFKPPVDAEQAKTRLRHLQRMSWLEDE